MTTVPLARSPLAFKLVNSPNDFGSPRTPSARWTTKLLVTEKLTVPGETGALGSARQATWLQDHRDLLTGTNGQCRRRDQPRSVSVERSIFLCPTVQNVRTPG